MRAATCPSPPPIQGAAESNEILVTLEVEQTFEQTRFDINELIGIPLGNKPWTSCYVPTAQIEPKTYDWDQIKTAPGICVIGKTCDGKFYEVAVCESYFPWLLSHRFKFELDLDYNRTEPADAEVRVYGILPARRRAQAHFLKNVIREISFGRGQKFEQYCRRIVPCELQIPLERAILNHHVLKSNSRIRNELCQWLVLIGLSLESNCSLVSELLGKDHDQLLQGFRQDYTDLLEDIPKNQQNAEFHRISLHWLLFVSCGAKHDFRPRKLDPRYTAGENANMIGSLIGIQGSNRFGHFDLQAMANALSQSKVFTKYDSSVLGIAKLASKIMTSLPIGFPEGYLDLPTEVLYGLGTGAVNEARTYWSHIYHQQPSLKKSDNNILLVLIWSSITCDVARNFNEWAASDDGLNLRRRLLKDVQKSQTIEQLALTLAAWLCFQRLFPCSSDTTQPIKGSFLADFDALLTGERLSNECTVLEHMIFSFSQALNNLGGDYQDTRQLLNAVLDTETIALERPDRTSVEYWIYRTKKRLAHKAAQAWTHGFYILQISKRFLAGVLATVLSARHDLICQIQSFLCPTLCYYFSTAVSAVVLYASIFRSFESSLACKILVFSTCGEFFALSKLAYVHHSPHQPDRWFLLVCASLSFLKFILTCIFFSLDWSELIGVGGLLAFSALFICGLQSALPQIYRLVAHSNALVTWREVRVLKKVFDVDVESGVLDLKLGRQYLRKGSLATLHSEFDYMSYTLVRLSNLGSHKRKEISAKLDKVGRLHEVSSALELPDESWEMIVLKSYLPELEIKLGEIFPGCHFHPTYDPTEPSREDVERLLVATNNSKLPAEPEEMVVEVKRCHTAAKILKINTSSSRAMATIREGCWPVAAAYYVCLLERNITWLKENAPHGRIEMESSLVVRKRSWRRFLSLLFCKRRSTVLSWKDMLREYALVFE